jgi:hypothetical protein
METPLRAGTSKRVVEAGLQKLSKLPVTPGMSSYARAVSGAKAVLARAIPGDPCGASELIAGFERSG